MSDDRCPDALFARSRRGPLSPVARRALDAHLSVCALCRGALLLATLYDDVPDVSDEDARATAIRLANRVSHRRTRSTRPQRFVALALAAAILAVAGGATAWVLVRRPRPTATKETSHVVPGLQGAGRVAFGPVRGGLAMDEPPKADTLPFPSSEPAPPDPIAPVAAELSARSSPPLSSRHVWHREPTLRPPEPVPSVTASVLDQGEGPAELFASANAARLTRAFPEAVTRYQLLQERFPTSAEARLSFFSTGDVLLRLGEPARALVEFERYLAAQPSGALAAEALFGRARCLDALGRQSEAIQAWRTLLRDFPASVYESAARRRLTELAP